MRRDDSRYSDVMGLGIYLVVLPVAFAGILYWLFTSQARAGQRARAARVANKAALLADPRIPWRVVIGDDDHIVLGALIDDHGVELRMLRFTNTLHARVAHMPLHDGERIARTPLGRGAEDVALGAQENRAAMLGESNAWVLWTLGDARARAKELPPSLVAWLDAHAAPALASVQFDDAGALTYVSADPASVAAMIGPLCDVAREVERALS